MKRLKKAMVAILLAFSLCLGGCSNEEMSNVDILAEAMKYDTFTEGRMAVLSIVPIFGMYNKATYEDAREHAQLSKSLEAEYFPNVTWSGSEFLSTPLTSECTELAIITFDDTEQIFMLKTKLSSQYGTEFHIYKVKYSVLLNAITSIEELGYFL